MGQYSVRLAVPFLIKNKVVKFLKSKGDKNA